MYYVLTITTTERKVLVTQMVELCELDLYLPYVNGFLLMGCTAELTIENVDYGKVQNAE